MTSATRKLKIIRGGFSAPIIGPQRQRLTVSVDSTLDESIEYSWGEALMPPGHYALPHLHAETDICVHIRKGKIITLAGPDLTPIVHAEGSYCHIGRTVPHLGLNVGRSGAEIVEWRSDKIFNRDVVRLPELDELAAIRVNEVLRDYHAHRLDNQFAAPTVCAVTW